MACGHGQEKNERLRLFFYQPMTLKLGNDGAQLADGDVARLLLLAPPVRDDR